MSYEFARGKSPDAGSGGGGGKGASRPPWAARPEPSPGRAGEPAGLLWSRLTDRDRSVLALLEAHRVLTTDQIWRLEFDSLRRAQHRMTELHRLGVVWRFRFPLLGGGSQPWHYTLGYHGARLQAAQRGEEPPRPQAYATKLERLAESPKLSHLLGVNDFFVSLARYARRNRLRDANTPHGDGLQLWLSEKEIGNHYARGRTSEFDQSGMRGRPDGFGCWQERGQKLAFHLEYDTGTEPLPRVAEKIIGYARENDSFAPYLDGMILFWLHSSRREQGLRAALAHHPTRVPIATAAADYGHPAGPAGPVWLPLNPRHGAQARLTLGQLVGAIGGTTPDGTPAVLANLRLAAEQEAQQHGYSSW